MNDTVYITSWCMLCGKPSAITVDKASYDRWRAGALVQEAFPDLSPADREVLISGSHPSCFDKAFRDEG